ncbi:arabinogalactan oligomer/maltooligosaccharide transport system permease protein [Kineosphaera limosa]|uniref:Putative ABC transporter permease protein n=1 Tax=Kineosphaera limosa NBRC 100340 TaxID=1184609 RepID=K6WUS4_9MICO|nr:sugar ABC transporter permease [Kineosphaera limosa]NYD99722.1 arabinogalactan oligomer/maltooligosaccharide transport system permease protein [Kineosphaera limosa]GAB95822.1 putative ABC transporter permease protein [Kineosphaera limosa NBRC 100340]
MAAQNPDLIAAAPTPTRTLRPSREGGAGRGATWWRHLVGIIVLAWALFPILFLLSAALNPSGQLSTSDLLPRHFSLQNVIDLSNDPARPYWTWYKNSLIICTVGAGLSVFIGALAAFAFSRLRFAGRRLGLLSLLLLQLFPAVLALVAMYITFAKVGDVIPAFGLNTTWGLLLAYMGGAMGSNVWLLKGYFDTIPREMDEAAIMDGASHARIFFTMTLRLVAPILVTVFMLSFVGLFGEFMLASVFLTDVGSQTLGVGLWSMSKGTTANELFGQFAAGSLLCSLPVMLLYLGFQKQLVGGLTQGSVK